jgi:drug/metabolite transporter, DME family
MTPERSASLLVVAAAVLWGTSGAAQELGPEGITPVAAAAFRVLLGGLLLVVVVAALLGVDRLLDVVRRGRGAALLASVAMAGFQLGYFGGIRLTGVAVGTLVAIGSAPVAAGLLDLARGRAPGLRWALATTVTLFGAGLLLAPDDGGATVRPAGIGLALLAGASYATYAVASKQVIEHGVDSTAAMAVPFLGASVVLVPGLAFVDVAWAATGRGIAVIAWLSIATIATGYTLFALGLRRLEASRATTLTLAEPLTAALVAVVVLHERLSGLALVGTVLMGLGLLLSGQGRRAPTPR